MSSCTLIFHHQPIFHDIKDGCVFNAPVGQFSNGERDIRVNVSPETAKRLISMAHTIANETGNNIAAVKFLKETMGLGLREAKILFETTEE